MRVFLMAAVLVILGRSGYSVSAGEAPQRVVSLAPNLTEMVMALGAGERLVGVTPFCTAPVKVTRVAGGIQAEVEAILALAPDLVLTTPLTSATARQQMRDLGIRVEVVDIHSLEDIRSAMLRLAMILGVSQPSFPPPVVYPPLGTAVLLFGAEENYSAGKGTHADEILRQAGFSNVAANVGAPWPVLSEEFLLSCDPDWILVADYGNTTLEKVLTTLRGHRLRCHWRAVREGRVMTIPASVFSVPGPAALKAVPLLRAAISAS